MKSETSQAASKNESIMVSKYQAASWHGINGVAARHHRENVNHLVESVININQQHGGGENSVA